MAKPEPNIVRLEEKSAFKTEKKKINKELKPRKYYRERTKEGFVFISG